MTIEAPTVVVLELELDRLETLPAVLRDLAFAAGGDRFGLGRHPIAAPALAPNRWTGSITIRQKRRADR